jgi:hypothetical protein
LTIRSSLDEEENNVRIDVPAFPLASEPNHKKSSEEATSSDTEVNKDQFAYLVESVIITDVFD